MTLLDYLHGSQNPIAAPDTQLEVAPSIDTTETKAEAVEATPVADAAETSTVEAPAAPAVLAADTTPEPAAEVSALGSEACSYSRQVTKQPTATHAELGNAHTDAEPATKVDGTTAAAAETAETTETTETAAAAPVEESKTAEVKKEEKKVAAKVSGAREDSD
jgi:hypothetical protein